MGLKTTYYLRTLAASQIEKSTLDAEKYGFTQRREYAVGDAAAAGTESTVAAAEETVAVPTADPQLCRVDDPDCEACQ